MRLFRFPDKFCADTRPYWVLFVGFVVSIALLIYTLYTREPERYRGIWRLFSAESGSSSSAPDIQMVAYTPPAGAPGAAPAALTFPSWNGASYPVAEFLGMTLNDVKKRGRLGQVAGAPTRGVVVTAIQQNSLSYWSGLRKGDLIVSLNRAPTPTVLDFQQAAGSLDASQGILLDVYRSGKLYYFTIDMQNQLG